MQLISILTSESGWEILLNFILLSTPENDSNSPNILSMEEIKRSYRAMAIFCDNLCNDSSMISLDNQKSNLLSGHSLFDSDKANLVGKRIFEVSIHFLGSRSNQI